MGRLKFVNVVKDEFKRGEDLSKRKGFIFCIYIGERLNRKLCILI